MCCQTRHEEEEEFITSGNWRGKHNSLSRGAGADQPYVKEFIRLNLAHREEEEEEEFT